MTFSDRLGFHLHLMKLNLRRFFSVPKNPIFSGIAGNLIFLIFSNWFYSGSMELQLTSATCLKIFIFPTFQNRKSISLSFLSNSLLRSVCFYPLHYFFVFGQIPWLWRPGVLE